VETRINDVEQVSGTSTLTTIVAKANGALYLVSGPGGSPLVTAVLSNTAGVANLVQSTPNYKNRLVNGDFGVDSITHNQVAPVPATLTELVDGWQLKYQSAAGSTALQFQRQPVTSPAIGTSMLSNYLQLSMPTGDTSAVAATDHAILQQTLPWGAVRDFAFGTTAAAPVTLSFWIFHETQGIYGGSLRNSAGTRSYPFSYTVISATMNKWQFVSSGWQLAFAVRAGSTYQCTAGAWTSTNCLTVTGAVNMGSAGSVSMLISGIQLEKSNVATAFDIRPYNTELMPAGSTAALRNAGSGLKNRLLNGAFNVDQMRRGAAVTPAMSGPAVDRWQMFLGGTNPISMFSVQQQQVNNITALAVAPPVGFSSYLAVRVLKTIDTPLSTDGAYLYQSIERRQMLDFQWGTPDALDVALSFYVRAPVAGLYSGALRGKGGVNRAFTFTYTVAAADTWQRVEIRVPGDTFEATPPLLWLRDGVDLNSAGLDVVFTLLAGSIYVATSINIGVWANHARFGVGSGVNIAHSSISNSAIYFTGVQLERGPFATAFDARPASEERRLVQRYVTSLGFGAPLLSARPIYASADAYLFVVQLPVPLRGAPTLTPTGGCDLVTNIDPVSGAVTDTGGWSWLLYTAPQSAADGTITEVTLRALKVSHGLSTAALSIRCPTSSDGFILSADF